MSTVLNNEITRDKGYCYITVEYKSAFDRTTPYFLGADRSKESLEAGLWWNKLCFKYLSISW